MLTRLTSRINVSAVNIWEYIMHVAAAGLAIVLLGATPAFSAGFEQVTVPDPGGVPLEAGIWYPSDAPALPQRLGLFEQTVAAGGAIVGHGLPLIVMSHGSGGSFEGHYDTALALAEAGFVVAAVTHTGDNYRDQSAFSRVENRGRHISALLDYMLASWPHHDLLDPARIGMFGFSAGGFTTLVMIGGKPDMTRVLPHCSEHPDEWACRKLGGTHTPRAVDAFAKDPRIAAAVIAAPAIGYTFKPKGLADVRAPIQLWRGDSDEILPHPYHAQNVYDALPTKPDYRVVPNAGHFAFLAPCTPALARVAPEICRDPEGFDRAAFHRAFNAAVVDFFEEKLRPPQ
jgi:predicted dienelactone hydrolase